MIVVFLIQLNFFVKLKNQQNTTQNQSLSTFNIFVLVYNIFAVSLQFFSFFIRSVFGPLILIELDQSLPILKFVEQFRFTMYSIADFLWAQLSFTFSITKADNRQRYSITKMTVTNRTRWKFCLHPLRMKMTCKD